MSDLEETQKVIDWNSARIPGHVQRLFYRCMECGNEVNVSLRSNGKVMPSMYCGHCENGPPLWKYAVRIDGKKHTRPGWDEQL